jgi:drug/metabolite transporter (DMT)-like permease
MPSYEIALVLLAAVLHAAWNLLAKRAVGGLLTVWLYGLVSSVAVLPLLAWRWPSFAAPGSLEWRLIVASALVHIAYSLILQHGYRVAALSVVYPVARGSGPLLSAIGAVLLLGEQPGLLGWIGILAIVAGIVLVAAPDGAQRWSLRGVGYGLATGISIAVYTLVDGAAMRLGALDAFTYFALVLLLRSLLLAPFALARWHELGQHARRHRRELVAIGVLSPLAYVLVLEAMRSAPVSLVAPLRELSMLVAVLFAAWFLHEAQPRTRWFGVGAMLVGVVALLH